MSGPDASRTQPGIQVTVPWRVAVLVGGPAEAGQASRVNAPDRVLRLWALLGNADEELSQARLAPSAVTRLHRQLDVITAELGRSVAPELAAELRRLAGCGGDGATTADELRIEYASVLAWTDGLVAGMLSQLKAARAKAARPPAAPRY